MSQHSVQKPPGAEISPAELRRILTGLMFVLTLAALDQNIVTTALPRITGDLGGLEHLSWVVTAFLVASTVSAPLYGRLSDLYAASPPSPYRLGYFCWDRCCAEWPSEWDS